MPNHTCCSLHLCVAPVQGTLWPVWRGRRMREKRGQECNNNNNLVGSCPSQISPPWAPAEAGAWFMNRSCILFLPMDMQVEVLRYPRIFEAWFPHRPMSKLVILLSQWKCNFQSAGKSLMKSAPNEGTGEGCIVGATEKYHQYHLSCQQWQEKGCKALAWGLWLNSDFRN